MKLLRYERSVRIRRPAAEVFAWHERPGAFERLAPPWEAIKVAARRGGIRDGGRVTVNTRVGPFPVRWEVEHFGYIPGVEFRDRQLGGPFAHWEHVHRVDPEGAEACVLTDAITYALPGGPIGALGASQVRSRLDRLFDYRHAVTQGDLELIPAAPKPLRVLVAGASGLVGKSVTAMLRTQGHEVLRLVRRRVAASDEIGWDPVQGRIDIDPMLPIDAVVNLAGASIAEGRWSDARREEIMNSRIQSTRASVQALLKVGRGTPVLVNASAVGYYGDRADAVLSEDAGPGAPGFFLTDVCRAWEGEVEAAASAGIRAVALRTGMVVTPAGGALAKLLPLAKAGLGGPLGRGDQWVSWITPDDLAGMIVTALVNPAWSGPINAVAPGPVRQADFAKELGRVLHRPAFLPAPAPALRLAMGRMADELLLASTRAVPSRAQALGFRFRHPDLPGALRHVLGRTGC